jgi:hypothetical protein
MVPREDKLCTGITMAYEKTMYSCQVFKLM